MRGPKMFGSCVPSGVRVQTPSGALAPVSRYSVVVALSLSSRVSKMAAVAPSRVVPSDAPEVRPARDPRSSRCGSGPHASEQVTPHPRPSRIPRLQGAETCRLLSVASKPGEETLQCGKPACVEGALCTATIQQFAAMTWNDVIGAADTHARESLQSLSAGLTQVHSRSCIALTTSTLARSCASMHAHFFRDLQCGGSISCQAHCCESAHFISPSAWVHVVPRSGVLDDVLFQAAPLCSDVNPIKGIHVRRHQHRMAQNVSVIREPINCLPSLHAAGTRGDGHTPVTWVEPPERKAKGSPDTKRSPRPWGLNPFRLRRAVPRSDGPPLVALQLSPSSPPLPHLPPSCTRGPIGLPMFVASIKGDQFHPLLRMRDPAMFPYRSPCVWAIVGLRFPDSTPLDHPKAFLLVHLDASERAQRPSCRSSRAS